MKKILLLSMLAIFATINVQAQEGEIIYRDLEPDLSIIGDSYYATRDTIAIDFDLDGTVDFKMYIHAQYPTMKRFVYIASPWDIRICFNSVYSYGYMDENDTILPYWLWPHSHDYELLWEPGDTHYMEFYVGFRKTVGDENYYAWARIYMYRNPNGQGHHPSHGDFDIIYTYCDDFAYCTIPNYPLRWGQTDITGVEENSEKAFATIHPNPASATLTITGENLKQIEITNMLGQCVATHQAEGTATTIDISSLPTGIYLATITDENGRRCVRKVLKE